ncbi:hypothetical protein KA405_03200 [Patescibacteria group bacterium]|nr:hypothetical protein [Patescibacteria group bacterium]
MATGFVIEIIQMHPTQDYQQELILLQMVTPTSLQLFSQTANRYLTDE